MRSGTGFFDVIGYGIPIGFCIGMALVCLMFYLEWQSEKISKERFDKLREHYNDPRTK